MGELSGLGWRGGLGGLPILGSAVGVMHSALFLLPIPQKWQFNFSLFVCVFVHKVKMKSASVSDSL